MLIDCNDKRQFYVSVQDIRYYVSGKIWFKWKDYFFNARHLNFRGIWLYHE